MSIFILDCLFSFLSSLSLLLSFKEAILASPLIHFF